MDESWLAIVVIALMAIAIAPMGCSKSALEMEHEKEMKKLEIDAAKEARAEDRKKDADSFGGKYSTYFPANRISELTNYAPKKSLKIMTDDQAGALLEKDPYAVDGVKTACPHCSKRLWITWEPDEIEKRAYSRIEKTLEKVEKEEVKK